MTPDEILRNLRISIDRGAIGFDGRLPPEREIAEKFSVSRGTIRKAFSVLEAEGRIQRHVGRGTFVRRHAEPLKPSSERIAEYTSPPEAMEARLLVEPELARLAALRATTAQINDLKRLSAAMRSAKTWAQYQEFDYGFHDKVAEASGNGLLVEVERLINAVRRSVVWGHLSLAETGPPGDYRSFAEHDAIVSAITARDRPGAATAMRAHLESTVAALGQAER
ncbi:MAG: FadR/GntR family transcriptional regulator [Pseudomonadota bacterium]